MTARLDAALTALLTLLNSHRSTLVRRATGALDESTGGHQDLVMVLDVRLRVSAHGALTDMVLPDGDDATRIVLSRAMPVPLA